MDGEMEILPCSLGHLLRIRCPKRIITGTVIVFYLLLFKPTRISFKVFICSNHKGNSPMSFDRSVTDSTAGNDSIHRGTASSPQDVPISCFTPTSFSAPSIVVTGFINRSNFLTSVARLGSRSTTIFVMPFRRGRAIDPSFSHECFPACLFAFSRMYEESRRNSVASSQSGACF